MGIVLSDSIEFSEPEPDREFSSGDSLAGIYIDGGKVNDTYRYLWNIFFSFPDEGEDRIVGFWAICGSADRQVFFGTLGIEADRDSIHQPSQVREDVTLVDEVAMAIGVEANLASLHLNCACDFLDHFQPKGGFTIAAEDHLTIPCGIADFLDQLFGRRLCLKPKIVTLDGGIIQTVAEGTPSRAPVGQVQVEGVSDLVSNGIRRHIDIL